MRKIRIVVLFYVVLSLFLFAPFVYPISAYIRPGRMTLDVCIYRQGKTIVGGYFEFKNLDDEDVHVTLEPSITLLNKMSLAETEFDLAPGETKSVYFEITLYSLGTYTGSLMATFTLVGDISLSTSISADIVVKALCYSDTTTTVPPTTTIPWVCREYGEECSSDSDCCVGICEESTVCIRKTIQGVCLGYKTTHACIEKATPTTTTTTTTTTSQTTTPTTTTTVTTTSQCETRCKLAIGSKCYIWLNPCSSSKTIPATTTTVATTSTIPATTTTVVTTIPGCLSSGSTCGSNEDCCSNSCVRRCVQLFGASCAKYAKACD